MIDTFSSGSAFSKNHPQTACPASWYATVFFSCLPSTLLFLSRPAMTRSIAPSKSSSVTFSPPRLAARRAASLHTLAMSAPEKPGVSSASFSAICSSVISLEMMIGLRCTPKIWRRPLMSGRSIAMCRSNRPGRINALSSTSGRFVPARTTTCSLVPNPSISTRS